MREVRLKRLAILGSTGSIGTQTLDIVSQYPEKFSVDVLTANNNVNLLISQAREFNPGTVVIGNEEHYHFLRDALADLPIKVFAGLESIKQVSSWSEIDIVIAGMVGFSGMEPVVEAVKAGKTIALANKESLVVAGEMISRMVKETGARIIPVDSEHSAILQCLVGEPESGVEKLTLTASGGPFREYTLEQMKSVTPEMALRHPNWDMGNKITIDSASMMNKGLEVIEAKWLFGVDPSRIEVIIHPQSIIHSLVHFRDGSVKAQMGLPDMRLPIVYALEFPDRIETSLQRFDFSDYPSLTFSKVDSKKFRNLAVAYKALEEGGNIPCIMNGANEIAVEAFLEGRTGFLEMTNIIEMTISRAKKISSPSLDDLKESDAWARRVALELINNNR
ncbi:MAG: 1-deoxy-D-xylulose-5-phosphate reductoisomerase [Bacteroidales bacterium]